MGKQDGLPSLHWALPSVGCSSPTTYLNFTRHAATTGRGPIGSGPELGFLLPSAWALTTGGVPLGLVAHIAGARDPATRGQRARRKP